MRFEVVFDVCWLQFASLWVFHSRVPGCLSAGFLEYMLLLVEQSSVCLLVLMFAKMGDFGKSSGC